MPVETLESSPLDFQVLRELSDVATLAPEWDSLLERSPCNRAFSSSRWFIATCRHNPSLQPNVVIARRGKALAGILPLVLTNEAQVAAFPNYLSDYSDAIAPANDPVVVAGLLTYACSAAAG
jgi:CelD/BcsL family acetyltransferase involved in cellulose biosynthesis